MLRESEPLDDRTPDDDDGNEPRWEPLLTRLPVELEEEVLAEKLLERANLEDEDEGDVEWPLPHFSFLDGFHISSIVMGTRVKAFVECGKDDGGREIATLRLYIYSEGEDLS